MDQLIGQAITDRIGEPPPGAPSAPPQSCPGAAADVDRVEASGARVGLHCFHIADVLAETLRLFEGDLDAAREWLTEPAKALGGSRPLARLEA